MESRTKDEGMSEDGMFGEILGSKEYVESKLKPLYPALWLAAMECWEHVLDRREMNDRAFQNLHGDSLAQWMRPQIAWRATEILEKHHPGVEVRSSRCGTDQMFAAVVDDVEVSFKKLDENLLRSNYHTRNQSVYWPRTLFSDNFSHRVIFGYRLQRSETELAVYLTMPKGQRNAWAVPIPDQRDAAARLRDTGADQGRNSEERKGFRVTKISKKDAAGGAG